MLPQFFKGDEDELKFYNSAAAAFDDISMQKDLFFADCFNCCILGDIIYESGRAPLANAIPQNVFRQSFADIFENFLFAGTLESYMSAFRSIFGDDVDIEFTIVAPGHLKIDIEASGQVLSNIVARSIINNAYNFANVVTRDGYNIVVRTVKGLESQYEVEQMLFEMVPAGIYTEITLTLGG